jgi:uncharacterized delta-60 repeat protein
MYFPHLLRFAVGMGLALTVACGSASSEQSGPDSGAPREASADGALGDGGAGDGLAADSSGKDTAAPQQSLVVTILPSSVSLPVGYSQSVMVLLSRGGGLEGAAAITVGGLPAGVTADSLTIPSSESSGELRLTAPAGTAVTSATVTIDAAVGTLTSSALLSLSVVAAQAGSLDPSFGTAGVTVALPDLSPSAAALQTDGSIVVVGSAPYSATPMGSQLAVARFHSDGSLDTSFGKKGEALFPLTPGFDSEGAVVSVQTDGKILVGGVSLNVHGTDPYAILRLESDGTLDTSFGKGGVVTPDTAGATGPFVGSLVQQADGAIAALMSGGTDFVLRLTATGDVDDTFGTMGQSATFVGGTSSWADLELAVDASGDFLAIGGSGVVRLAPEGSLDPTFNGSTKLAGLGPVVAPDGSVFTGVPADASFAAVTKLTSAGLTDTTYGTSGVAYPYWGSTLAAYANAMALDSKGRMVLAGSYDASSGTDIGIGRLTAAGVPDTTFGSGGGAVTAAAGGAPDASPVALAFQTDGRIVVVAWAMDLSTGKPFGVMLARYLP